MTVLDLVLLATAPAIGSFAALAADRAETGRSAIAPRSRCDGCGRPIAPQDLVPILSFLWLGGRARCCGARIPAHLPGLELASFAIAAWGLSATTAAPEAIRIATVGLGTALVGLAWFDLRHFRLPDAATLPLLLGGLALSAAGLTGPMWSHAAGAAAGYALIAGIDAAYRRIRGQTGLGLGDAKLLAAGGAWTGLAALPSILLLGALAGIGTALLRGSRWREPLPFGPGLALGIWLAWCHGPVLLMAP
ncbi:MAG: prepilin peptidase [Paracoccaceae bacterium]